MQDLPLAVLAATVSSYWIGVGVMIARVRRHTRKVVGLVPEQRLERLMWVVWVPMVAVWIYVPWAALAGSLVNAQNQDIDPLPAIPARILVVLCADANTADRRGAGRLPACP